MGEGEWLRRLALGSDVLDVIIGGHSAIDTPYVVPVQTLDEASHFLESYGFSLADPIEAAELMGNYQEALSFIRKYFLQPENPEGLKLEIPRKILELTDVRELLLMANRCYPGQSHDPQGEALKHWACALLKVMHTVAHIDKDLRSSYFSEVQKQIFDRFYKEVHRDEQGQLFLGENEKDPERIDLVAFDTKPKKTRESTILKLLHKSENVAEELFDRVGVRFVTPNLAGTLRVVKYLKDHHIVLPPNIKPSRSRNTLIDIKVTRAGWHYALAQADKSGLQFAQEADRKRIEADLENAIQKISDSPGAGQENRHTSDSYRALQFTGRQLIKIRNPLFQEIREIRALSKELDASSPLARAIQRIDMKFVQKEIRFFYPFEVQILDQGSFESNEQGQAAHHEYKRAQVQTALRRVMSAWVERGTTPRN